MTEFKCKKCGRTITGHYEACCTHPTTCKEKAPECCGHPMMEIMDD